MFIAKNLFCKYVLSTVDAFGVAVKFENDKSCLILPKANVVHHFEGSFVISR